MDSTPRKWQLSPEAFELFLQRLAPDREQAAREYEALRRKLVDFFDWRGSQFPESLADETFDRVARKLNEGEIVEHVGAYAYGVARRVLQELYKRTLRERTALDRMMPTAVPTTPMEDSDARLSCLKKCLQQLPEDGRALIISYYDGEGRAHLSERKALAEQLGLVYATLKTRAHRIRGVLEGCLQHCLQGGIVRSIGAAGHS